MEVGMDEMRKAADLHIPNEVFGRAIKDEEFRKALVEDPRQALDKHGIYASEQAIEELEGLKAAGKLDPLDEFDAEFA